MADTEKVEARPEKDFFISMITRDITLDACVLDLVDNAIDGAKRTNAKDKRDANDFSGYSVEIEFSGKSFSITDNCGGIPVALAKDYAFRFGRSPNQKEDTRESIGLYGIGMKRAVFKLGKVITIHSSTDDEAFDLEIDVPQWERTPVWEFGLTKRAAGKRPETTILVKMLHPGVKEELVDPVFETTLVKDISRVYSLFIQRGLAIRVQKKTVPAFGFTLREGGDFKPVYMKRKDDGVLVEIWGGLAGAPPEDDSAESRVSNRDIYGWYVVCNGRVVLAGDKTERTVWGDNDEFPAWHNQYNGFLGMVSFHSDDPSKLPWTTTKAEIDTTSPLYRRAVVQMKEVTRAYIDYTTRRKGDLETAKKAEADAKPVPLDQVKRSTQLKLPQLALSKKIAVVNIAYQKPMAEVKAVARALGNPSLAYRTIGVKTFEYFKKREVDGK
jgi:hypothetical protein